MFSLERIHAEAMSKVEPAKVFTPNAVLALFEDKQKGIFSFFFMMPESLGRAIPPWLHRPEEL